MKLPFYALAAFFLAFAACTSKDTGKIETKKLTAQANDPHSFAKPAEAVVKHLDLDLIVDFELRQISGTATYQLQKANDAKEIVLDTKALTIKQITDGNGKEIAYTLSDNVEFLGRALHIPLSE